MTVRIFLIGLTMLGLSACAARSNRGAFTDENCARRGDPVPFTRVFTDSAAVADLIRPLVRERGDTVTFTPSWYEGVNVYVDTAAVADSVEREALGEEIARFVVATDPAPDDPLLGFRGSAYHDQSGAIVYRARSVVFCPPVMENRDEISRALQRAQAAIMMDARLVLWIMVDTTGIPSRVDVHESSGNDHVDATAIAVGHVARFTPARVDGEATRVWVQLPVTFQIHQ